MQFMCSLRDCSPLWHPHCSTERGNLRRSLTGRVGSIARCVCPRVNVKSKSIRKADEVGMPERNELTFEDYIQILYRRWPVILAVCVVGGGAGFGVARFLPKRYTSQTLVLVQQPTVPGDYVKPLVGENTTERL